MLLWEFVKENWDMIVYPQLGENTASLERWLRFVLSQYCDFNVEKQVAAFFKDRDTGGYDIGLKVARDNIIGAAKYKARDEDRIKEWLKVNGYS